MRRQSFRRSKAAPLARGQRWLGSTRVRLILIAGICLALIPLGLVLTPEQQTHSNANTYVLVPPDSTASVPATCAHAALAANPVASENTCPGTNNWQQDYPLGDWNAMMAYADPASVNIGQSIKLYISTTAPTYAFQVYRIGWYQGYGARLMYSSPRLPGINQPEPLRDPTTHMASGANWQDPVTLHIPTSWVSGVYIIKLLSFAGNMRYTFFIVRNDASHAPILYQVAVMTYQAYNNWGGHSLYGSSGAMAYAARTRGQAVSFDRPYVAYAGLAEFARYEYNLIRWLERGGFNISYMADIDLVLHPQPLTQHKLILDGGHDEYWSTGMRQVATKARDAGVSLAFFSANNVYWHVRLANSSLGPDRVIICYKNTWIDPMGTADPLRTLDPREVTVQWRQFPVDQPENSLLGEMFAGVAKTPMPLVFSAGAQPFLIGTGLRVGSQVPEIVSGEVDMYVKNTSTPLGVTILTSSPVNCTDDLCQHGQAVANATIYTAPSGARVFDAGTFYWAWGLDDSLMLPSVASNGHANADFQRFTANILNSIIGA